MIRAYKNKSIDLNKPKMEDTIGDLSEIFMIKVKDIFHNGCEYTIKPA